MAYKRRFTQYGDEKEQRGRYIEHDRSPKVDDSGVTPFGQSIARPGVQTMMPTSTQHRTGGIKDEPELYDSQGNINKKYDTSIGQDVLGGAAVGAQVAGRSDNPFFQLGALAGGAVGGAFNKNLRGKQKHKQDVEEVRAYNREQIEKTEAQMRLEAQQTARMREQRMQESQMWNQQYKAEMMDSKTAKDRIDRNLKLLDTEPDPEKREMILKQLEQDGVPRSDNGVKMKPVKVGDMMMVTDDRGNFHNAIDPDTGQPLTIVSTSAYLDILKKMKDLEDAPEDSVKMSVEKAKEMVKDMQFKTAGQKSAAVINLAKTILKEQGKGTGTVTIGNEKVVIDIPQFNKPPLAKETDKSPFMSDEPAVGGEVIDATTGEKEGPMAKDILPIKGEEKKQPKIVTQSDQEFPLSIVNNKGEAYATRPVKEGTETLDKKKTYLSKDKKSRLVFMDGAWYQVKLQ